MGSTRRSGWSEERLLRWFWEGPGRRAAKGLPTGGRVARGRAVGSPGHDAAVLRAEAARQVACVDHTVEGVHFEPATSPRHVAEKALGRALSDLAATAARPRAVLLALAAPAATPERWMRAVLSALTQRAGELGAELVGGDLCARPGPRSLAVTALGSLPGSRRPPGRDRARAGDLVLATGAFGGAGLGRHLRIRPRLEEGRRLHAGGARAMMDVSDGLARDLARIAAASRVRIDLESVPIHGDARRLARRSGRTPLEHALGDGEDHELLATAPAARARALLGRMPGLVELGRVRRGSGLWIRAESGALVAWDGSGGYTHGH